MVAISMIGPMFTWFMIFVTHVRFRRLHTHEKFAFRMWGYPYTSLIGAALMLAALITTFFTREFRPTLVYGIPFLIVLTVAYYLRRASAAGNHERTSARGI
jgi:AAT family amino acid transporter